LFTHALCHVSTPMHMMHTTKIHQNFNSGHLWTENKDNSFFYLYLLNFLQNKTKNPTYGVVAKSSILQQILMALFKKNIFGIWSPPSQHPDPNHHYYLLPELYSNSLIDNLASVLIPPSVYCQYINQGDLLEIKGRKLYILCSKFSNGFW